MDLYTINLIYVVGTFLVYIGIAIWARAGSTSEFFLAHRSVHPFFFSSRRRHTRFSRDWSSDVCSSDLGGPPKRPAPSPQLLLRHRQPGLLARGVPRQHPTGAALCPGVAPFGSDRS